MKQAKINQAGVIESSVAMALRSCDWNDLPAIREALNDTMDYYEKEGMLSQAVADTWSQQRMVKAVQKILKT